MSHQLLAASSPADVPKMMRFHRQNLRLCKKDDAYKSRSALHRTPAGYSSWRNILANLVLHSACLSTAVQRGHTAEVEHCIAAKQALLDDSPLRHLDRELAEAFLRTRIGDIEPPPLAFDHLMINLPSGLLADDWGVPITVILVSTWASFKGCLNKAGVRFVGLDHSEGLEIVGLTECGTALIDTTSWQNMGKALGIRPGNAVKGWEEETQDACMKMQRLAVHTLLTMAHKPELITTEAVTSSLAGSGFKLGTKQRQTRDITWVGKGFRRAARARSESDDKEGAPKAPHWRAGHWHTVRHGKGKQLARLDWYQPVYVNPSTST